MTKRLLVEETYWYLAYQDGPADNERYPTEDDAKTALKNLRKRGRGVGRDICIMSKTIYREPNL